MPTKHTTILVTGCAGFIGSQFVLSFKERFPKATIVGIDDFSTGRRDAVDRSIIFYEGSICDGAFLDTVFKKHKPDYVFHFAALPRISFSVKHLSRTTDVNIGGTVSLLEKCRDYGIKRFIFSSSSSVYGNNKELPTSEKNSIPNPVSPYALHKYAGERVCRLASTLYRFDTVCLRYFTVFGPGQFGDSAYATVISAWLTGLYFPSEKELFLEGTGRQSRDFCYVDNVIQANINAMLSEKHFNGDAFNIAHGETTSLLSAKKMIEKFSGKKLNLSKRPIRPGDVKDTHADISKAKKQLKYKPTVNFENGLKKTIAWFEQRHAGTKQ
ncbi:MAG: hypothetical protein JWM20_821 [Patescibacteria group bacterium]|nr:hypothetical protein [Patescibacteria group bacterium]